MIYFDPNKKQNTHFQKFPQINSSRVGSQGSQLKYLVTGQEAILCPFLRMAERSTQELPYLCAREDHGTYPSGSDAKARGRQGGDTGEPK